MELTPAGRALFFEKIWKESGIGHARFCQSESLVGLITRHRHLPQAQASEPFAYLKALLEATAAGHPQSRIDELLPWNFNPST